MANNGFGLNNALQLANLGMRGYQMFGNGGQGMSAGLPFFSSSLGDMGGSGGGGMFGGYNPLSLIKAGQGFSKMGADISEGSHGFDVANSAGQGVEGIAGILPGFSTGYSLGHMPSKLWGDNGDGNVVGSGVGTAGGAIGYYFGEGPGATVGAGLGTAIGDLIGTIWGM